MPILQYFLFSSRGSSWPYQTTSAQGLFHTQNHAGVVGGCPCCTRITGRTQIQNEIKHGPGVLRASKLNLYTASISLKPTSNFCACSLLTCFFFGFTYCLLGIGTEKSRAFNFNLPSPPSFPCGKAPKQREPWLGHPFFPTRMYRETTYNNVLVPF